MSGHKIGQDWVTTTLNALESSCDPQRSTVTHIHQNLNGTLAKKSPTIVGCASGIAPYGVYHFAEAIIVIPRGNKCEIELRQCTRQSICN